MRIDFHFLRLPRRNSIADKPANLSGALLALGYSEEDVAKIWGGNWLRVFEKVWGGSDVAIDDPPVFHEDWR